MPDSSAYAATFALVDSDGDGLISATELVTLMKTLGDDVSLDTARRAVEQMDTDADGEISLDEFANYLSQR